MACNKGFRKRFSKKNKDCRQWRCTKCGAVYFSVNEPERNMKLTYQIEPKNEHRSSLRLLSCSGIQILRIHTEYLNERIKILRKKNTENLHNWEFSEYLNGKKVWICIKCGIRVEASRFPSPRRSVSILRGRAYNYPYRENWVIMNCDAVQAHAVRRVMES